MQNLHEPPAKGKAVQTVLKRATGEICVIHDADLEYHSVDDDRVAPSNIKGCWHSVGESLPTKPGDRPKHSAE